MKQQVDDAVQAEEDRFWQEEHRKELARKRAEKRDLRIRNSSLPEALRGIEFPEGHVGDAARRWADGEIAGLCLEGPVGVGKTWTAAAACWAKLQREACQWVPVARLMTQMRAGFEDESRKLATRSILRANAVVLDDLDKVTPTDYGKEIIFAAIDGRVEAGQPLLVTTNLTPSEIGQRFGDAVMSRLAGYCTTVRMKGVDRRVA